MASLIPNKTRGTWQVQWHDGRSWKRVTVVRKRPGWKPKDGLPRKPPPQAVEALARFQRREDASRFNRTATPDVTVTEFLDAYLEDYRVGHRPRSAVRLGYAADRFRAFCGAAKITRLDEVTPAEVDRYLLARTRGEFAGKGPRGEGQGGAAYNTVRGEAGLLSGAWAKAVKLRRVTENPWKNAEVPGGPPRKEKTSWSPGDYEKLLAACRPWLRRLVILGAHTGIRVTALTQLRWDDLQFDPSRESRFGWVIVRPEIDKAKEGYRVPIHKRVHDIFLPDKDGAHKHPFVLSNQAGDPIGSVGAVGHSIHKACSRAGLPKPDSPCHALRRTFGQWAVHGHLRKGKTIPVYVVQKWYGHHSIEQTQDYLGMKDKESQDWMAGPDE